MQLQASLTTTSMSSPSQHHSRAARTRFYARRVQESLTSRIAMFLCSILLTLLLIAGVIILILWLSFLPHRPLFYLSSFSSPSLSTLSFDVSDRNPNAKIAIFYSDITATIFYNNLQLATGVVQSAFYQPPKSTTEIRGQLITTNGQNLSADAAANNQVALRLELSSVVRFKLSTWDTHPHNMHISCELALGADGNLLPEFMGERCSLYFG